MKIIISGFPGAAITVSLIKNDLDMEEITPQNIWFNDFIPTIGKMVEENDINEIIFFGQNDFIQGLGRQLQDNINLDGIIVTYINENKEDELQEGEDIDD